MNFTNGRVKMQWQVFTVKANPSVHSTRQAFASVFPEAQSRVSPHPSRAAWRVRRFSPFPCERLHPLLPVLLGLDDIPFFLEILQKNKVTLKWELTVQPLPGESTALMIWVFFSVLQEYKWLLKDIQDSHLTVTTLSSSQVPLNTLWLFLLFKTFYPYIDQLSKILLTLDLVFWSVAI